MKGSLSELIAEERWYVGTQPGSEPDVVYTHPLQQDGDTFLCSTGGDVLRAEIIANTPAAVGLVLDCLSLLQRESRTGCMDERARSEIMSRAGTLLDLLKKIA
jgi:hypothetical protein